MFESESWLYILFLVALLIAIKNILQKDFLRSEHTLQLLFWSSLFSMIFSLLFFAQIQFTVSGIFLMLIAIKALFYATAEYCYIHAMRKMEISFVVPLRNLSPFFALFASALFLGERLTLFNYVGIMIILFGAYFHELRDIKHLFEPLMLMKEKNVSYIMIAVVLFGFGAVLDKVILSVVHPLTLLFYTALFCTLYFFFGTLAKHHVKHLHKPLKKHYILILLISILFIFSESMYFLVLSMPNASVSLVITLKRTSALFSTLIGGSLFRESRLPHKILSCAIMVVGIFVMFL